jgi:23S rRNA (uracil1939-C5)-methyltransferase
VVDGRAAFRMHHSHDPITIDTCLVAHPLVDDVLQHGRFGAATEVTVRAGVATGERSVLADPPATRLDVADDVDQGVSAHVHEDVDGRRFRISTRSFFQSRPDGAAALTALVRDAVGERKVIADLYCGVGILGASCDQPERILAVESSRSAVADAKVNLRGFNAHVVHADVAKLRPVPVAVVIADPSRAGLGKAIVKKIRDCEPKRVVLVSCDAAAMARDLALLDAIGFDLRSITPVDMFPHTPHVECVSVLDAIR